MRLRRTFRMAATHSTSASSWYQLGLLRAGTSSYSESITAYKKAIALNPKLAAAYEYRGVLYTQMGRKADAEKDLAALKKLDSRLAGELEEYIKTGKEDDDLYGSSEKLN